MLNNYKFLVVAKTRPGPEVAETRPRPNFFWSKKKTKVRPYSPTRGRPND